MNRIRLLLFAIALVCCPMLLPAQQKVPPYDLWTDQVLAEIRNRSTLEVEVRNSQYSSLFAEVYEVFYTSNPAASFFDSTPPYAEHKDEKIRIHAYLAVPRFSGVGPFPGFVIGHGHGLRADPNFASAAAALGYVALCIDGPRAGQSTGGPQDDNQGWISVDKGPQYGYLYHYAYAGMRALTLLEELGTRTGNPYRIDPSNLGVLGPSMGGIFTTYLNGIDSRVKAAIIIASAGNWQHTLRYPNSWLYHGIYASTRDLPYNGSDPLNSIENVDTDPTGITFMNYFDPIRYAPRQYAPVMTIIGTHDEYFPLPNANLMQLAITSAGVHPTFEKRLWLVPNAPHSLENEGVSGSSDPVLTLRTGLEQWLKYCFGKRDKPLAAPQVTVAAAVDGLRFDVTLAETAGRLAGTQVVVYVGTRVDSTSIPIRDFKPFNAAQEGDRFVARVPAGEKTTSGDLITAENAIYYATATDAAGLPVSSLVSKGRQMMDLSTDFTPAIEQYPGSQPEDKIVAPLPPPPSDAAATLTSSLPLAADASYQGMALTNATDIAMSVRVEAVSPAGRIAAAEGLVNPVFLPLAPHSQSIFLAENWFGTGARQFNGSFRMGWSDARGTSLAFRGNARPSELDGIGPLVVSSSPLWLPLAPEQDPAATRRLRIISGSAANAAVTVTFRNKSGTTLETRQITVPAGGTSDLAVSLGSDLSERASAEVRSSVPVSVRLEVTGARDTWSIEGRPVSSAPRLIQPHVEWNGTFVTRLLILNTSSSPQQATMRLRGTAGTAAAPDVVESFPGNSVTSRTVETVFSISSSTAPDHGWLEIENPGGQLLIVALAANPKSGAAAASTLAPSATGSWSMPFFVENAAYWSGLALSNAGDVPSNIRIAAYSAAGALLGRADVVLGSKQSKTQLVSQWITGLPNDATGQIVFTTSAPLSLLAYFGTLDGAALAAIPFTPISP